MPDKIFLHLVRDTEAVTSLDELTDNDLGLIEHGVKQVFQIDDSGIYRVGRDYSCREPYKLYKVERGEKVCDTILTSGDKYALELSGAIGGFRDLLRTLGY